VSRYDRTPRVACLVCGASLAGRRAGTKTCSGKCRMAALRARRAADHLDLDDRSLTKPVTVSGTLVTLAGLVGGPCPDPNRCRYFLRHAAGPWTCAYNHPRVHEGDAAI
jgi:hypothetical protein